MINEVIIMGRIVNELEPHLTGENMVLKFNIAVNNNDVAEFFSVECWNKVALNVIDYAQKGTLILVKGRLKQDRFTGTDGKNKSIIKIKAKYITVLSQRPKEANEPEEQWIQYLVISPKHDFKLLIFYEIK